MEKDFYSASWPAADLKIEAFVHEVMNFRYHWHPDVFELNILLSGQQYFCRGRESHLLKEGDMILIDPNTGHASYGQTQNTIALVIHFDRKVFRQFTAKGEMLSFPSCISSADSSEPRFARIRALAASLILSLSSDSPYTSYISKAAGEALIAELLASFSPVCVSSAPEVDEETQKIIRSIMQYIETHYAEKIALEDIASITGYNRTYISTLFHKSVGISFYDYLMRVRLQNALKDLVMTDKNLTDIALTNGFPDSKSFNRRFRELLNCLPSEYRTQVLSTPELHAYHQRRYIPVSSTPIREKLESFMNIL